MIFDSFLDLLVCVLDSPFTVRYFVPFVALAFLATVPCLLRVFVRG